MIHQKTFAIVSFLFGVIPIGFVLYSLVLYNFLGPSPLYFVFTNLGGIDDNLLAWLVPVIIIISFISGIMYFARNNSGANNPKILTVFALIGLITASLGLLLFGGSIILGIMGL